MAKLPIALQLYTVRDLMAKDLAGTLKAVAQIGYTHVEAAGFHNLAPADFRQACDAAGLRIVSAHMGLPAEDKLGDLVKDLKALGSAFVCIGMPGDLRQKGAEGYKTHAKNCEKAALALKKSGITLCYHNHSFEFVKFDGKYGLDLLYEGSAPDSLQGQFDVYWIQHGNENPAPYLTKWKDRCKLVHLKDMLGDGKKSFAEVGRGILDWPAIFKACAPIRPAWYIVEQDLCAGSSLDSARISFASLKTWGYA